MDFITLVLLVLLVVLAYLMAQPDPEQARIKALLEKIPGPPILPIVGNGWGLLTRPLHRHIEVYRERQKKYGPIFRTWRGSVGEVNINTAEGAEVLLSNAEYTDRSMEYKYLESWLGDGIFLRQGQRWRNIRKVMSVGFSSNIIYAYTEVFQKNGQIFLEKMKDKADGEAFNISQFLRRYTLDIVCETTTGVLVDAQNENNMSYANAIHNGLITIGERHVSPWLQWDFTFNLSNTGKRFNKCFSTVHNFIRKIIQERKKIMDETQEVKDLHRFDSEVRRKNLDLIGIIGKNLTQQETHDMVETIIFAGHDTTFCALSWAIQLLGEHLDIQDKVYEEMEKIFEGSDRPPTREDYQEMKYLDCVIKETLRLYPSAPALGRSTKTDIQVGDYLIPAGASIWIQVYFIHRDPRYFPNPEEFNPDNFLPENVRNRHPYAYLAFSAGARNCLGQKYAMMETKTILSYIIRNFEIKSLRKTKDIPEIHAMTLSPLEGISVTLKTRQRKDKQIEMAN